MAATPARTNLNATRKAGQGVAAFSHEINGRILTHRNLHKKWTRIFHDHTPSDATARALDAVESEMRENIDRLKALGHGKRARATI